MQAQGTYIMFLDSDDTLFSNACETAYNAINKNQTDAVQFGVLTRDSNGNEIIKKDLLTHNIDRLEDKNWLSLWNNRKIRAWTIWNKIYKADLCKKAYKMMENRHLVMGEDVYFFVYLAIMQGLFQ